jgi:hypothetical protein
MRARTVLAGSEAASRMGKLAALGTALFALMAADAAATIRTENHLQPAGDPTVLNYRIFNTATGANTDTFTLRDGEDDGRGNPDGTYTIQAILPAGWRTVSIQCVGPPGNTFGVNLATSSVTVVHTQTTDNTCAFTNTRVGAAAGGAGTSGTQPGIPPTPPARELVKNNIPQPTDLALLGVRSRLRSALATIRLKRSSVIRAQLRSGKRVVGSTRVVRAAGTRSVTVKLSRDGLRRLRRSGRRTANLTLRIVVAERNGATKVFTWPVRVRLR